MSRLRRVGGWVRDHWRGIAAVLVAVVLVAAGGFVWYFSTPHHANPAQLERATDREDVSVSRAHGGYVIEPAERPEDEPRVGLIFYPGGRVHPDAYVPSLAPIAAGTNLTVIVPKVRLNLAVLDRNRAAEIMDAHPEIDRWYVGGHSLGGSMACRFAKGNTDRVAGVVLFASYCDRDVSDTDLEVLSVTGAADAVLDRTSYEDARSNLPDDAVTADLRGVNHSQFGAYVGQRGGKPSGTTFETAHDRLASVVVPWFSNRSAAVRAAPASARLRAISTAERRGPETPPAGAVRPVSEGF